MNTTNEYYGTEKRESSEGGGTLPVSALTPQRRARKERGVCLDSNSKDWYNPTNRGPRGARSSQKEVDREKGLYESICIWGLSFTEEKNSTAS